MAYDNSNSGVLFRNEKKTSDKSPDYTGSCEVNGEAMYISAWIKEGKNGKFMSLAFKPKEEKKDPNKRVFSVAPEKPKAAAPFDDMESDCPF